MILVVSLVGGASLFWLLQEGSVYIQSTPPGAELWLDGQQVGVTPLTLRTRLLPSQGTLEFRLAGYAPQKADISLEPRQAANLTVTLTPNQGRLAVRSEPPGAKVFLDNTPAGVTPLAIEKVELGPHRIRLELPDYAEWDQEITVKPDGDTAIAGTLTGLPGTFEVSSTPTGGTVFVDGQERGVTPLALREVTPGEHEVKVTKPGYADWLQRLTVGPNAKVQALATLARTVEEASLARPIAAMIDNHPYARPQAGLAQADIVYEALAEGGITRFMGLFFTQPVDKVGPIRSARHYFVYWADEYDAMYAHCGGYQEASAALAETGVVDLDDLKGSPGFWRSGDRSAPHNLYTSTADLRAEADRRGIKQDAGTTAGLLLADAPQPVGQPAKLVTMRYPYDYTVTWEYDQAQNNYRRFSAGAPHVDQATGQQLRGSNVVVLFMRNWFMGGDDQQDFQVTGSGRALFFLDGKVVEGKWTRAALDQPTLYWNSTGEKVTLNKGGTTWIQVVPTDATVVVE